MPDNASIGLTATELGVKTAKTASFVVFGKFFSVLIGGMLFILIARLLGPSKYGIYTLSLAISGFVGAFGGLSVGSYFNRYIPEFLSKNAKERIAVSIGDGLLLLLGISALLSLTGILLGSTISALDFGRPGFAVYVDVAMLGIIASLMSSATYSVLISFGAGKPGALQNMTNVTTQAIVSITLILLGFGALGAIAGYISGLTLSTITGLFLISRRSPILIKMEGMKARMHDILRFSLPITGTGIVTNVVSNLSVMLLGMALIPIGVIGQYGVASKIGTLIDIASGSISIVLVPMFATAIYNRRTKEKLPKLYESSIYYGLIFTAPVIAYVSILSRSIVMTLFTLEYSSTILYIPLISIGLLIGFIGSYSYSFMISTGKLAKILKYSVIAGISSTALMLLTVPFLGVLGVIFSVLYAGNIITSALSFRHLSKEGISVSYAKLAKVILANIALAAVLMPLMFSGIRSTFLLLIGMALLLLAYPPLLGLTRAASSEDAKRLGRISSGIPVIGWFIALLIHYTEFFIR